MKTMYATTERLGQVSVNKPVPDIHLIDKLAHNVLKTRDSKRRRTDP